MGRNKTVEGITLHARRFQEYHKDVTILSREGGITNCVLHGGYKGKSRMAGATEPFRYGKFLLYHNPVKDSYKISDCEVLDPFEEFRKDLAKIYLVSLWSEIMIKTRGAGAGTDDGENVFLLLLNSLELLKNCPSYNLPRLDIQFLWRFLALSGLGIPGGWCVLCGRELGEKDLPVYSFSDQGFLCSGCLKDTDRNTVSGVFSPGASRYLMRTINQELETAVKAATPGGEELELERLPLRIIVSEMEIRLKTQDYHKFIINR